MTPDPRTVEPGDTVVDAAREMRDGDVGDVLVTENGRLVGIVTDHDIAVRVIAEARDPQATRSATCAPPDPVTLTVEQTVEDAIRLVSDHDVRRIPVVQDGRPAGVVTIGDLAIERDPESVLADISSEPANN